jgi:putative MFS transporter
MSSANTRGDRLTAPENAPLTYAHWTLMSVLAAALIIDIMKPASLGFVTPGMCEEYGVDRATVAMLPFSALVGTVLGSFVWGALADLYGRRIAILLSAVMYIGTSICGAMPSLWWNIAMCFLMGAAAGGMLPVTYALLAEIMPTKHRGWCLVLVGGIGAVGGYLASSGLSALLQPLFGWRIMWFLNLPTGLVLISLSPLIPESARFLQQIGRAAEARGMLVRFGAVVTAAPDKFGQQRSSRSYPLAASGSPLFHSHGCADACRARLGIRQFRRAAIAAELLGGRGPQRRPCERDHREIDAVRHAHDRRGGLSL